MIRYNQQNRTYPRYKQTFTIIFISYISLLFTGCKNKEQKQNFDWFPGPENSFQELLEAYEDPERDEWQNPDLIIQLFGPLQEKTVADIGAGSGYFTFPLANNGAKVLALEIDERFISYLNHKIEDLGAPYGQNIETRKVYPNDPKLKPNEVDAILMVNTITFIDQRKEYLLRIKEGLKPGGKILIVDYKKERQNLGPSIENRLASSTVVNALKEAGFANIVTDRLSLPYQYIIIAEN